MGGIDAEIESSATAALQKILTSSFDLVFVDVFMPEMSGYELSRKVREEEVSPKRTTLIALSAAILPSQIKKAQEAGMEAFLAKPIHLDPVFRTLVKWLEGYEVATQEHVPGADDTLTNIPNGLLSSIVKPRNDSSSLHTTSSSTTSSTTVRPTHRRSSIDVGISGKTVPRRYDSSAKRAPTRTLRLTNASQGTIGMGKRSRFSSLSPDSTVSNENDDDDDDDDDSDSTSSSTSDSDSSKSLSQTLSQTLSRSLSKSKSKSSRSLSKSKSKSVSSSKLSLSQNRRGRFVSDSDSDDSRSGVATFPKRSKHPSAQSR